MEWLVRGFLGERAARLRRFDTEAAGYDGARVFRWLTAFFVVGAAIYCISGVRLFVRFDATGMELGRPFRLASRYYPDGSVKAIEHRASLIAPLGQRVHRPHYIVVFDDGLEWEIDHIYDVGPGGDRELAQYIAQRSGRSIVERP